MKSHDVTIQMFLTSTGSQLFLSNDTSLAVLLHGLTVNFLHFTGQDKMWTFCRILHFSTFESERKALNCLPLPLHSLNALKLM